MSGKIVLTMKPAAIQPSFLQQVFKPVLYSGDYTCNNVQYQFVF